MDKKICKIIIIIMVILAIIIGIMYLIDLDRMKKGKEVVFSTWGAKYAPIVRINNSKNYQKYSKTIDNTKIELSISNEWKYEEVPKDENNNFYKYALKIYKNNENQYAMLYFCNDKFAVCGTGRTSRNITLDNGKEATIGYYDGNKNWSDISFHKINEYIAVVNYNLINSQAEEVIEFIKTINITDKPEEQSFLKKVIESNVDNIIVCPKEDKEERKTVDKFSLVFYQKTMIQPNQKETIISKDEIKGIDYNIYAFEGHIAINLNNDSSELLENSISLRDALLQNKITMDEIIAKASNTVSYDDGSMEYHYGNYTIIKLHTLDGNRDVYIGGKITINDLDI